MSVCVDSEGITRRAFEMFCAHQERLKWRERRGLNQQGNPSDVEKAPFKRIFFNDLDN